MKQKEYDYFSSSSSSSSYIQFKNNNHNMLNTKSKQSFFHFISIYSYLIIFILIFLISSFIFFHTKNSHISINHRLKRQTSNINDKQHYTDMLRRMLLLRTSSSALADCTINMALEGIYRLPSEDSLSSQTILLIEQSFQTELFALKRTAGKIRAKLNQTSNYFADQVLEKFRNEFSLDIRILLASQIRIKEIDVRVTPIDNGGSYVIKYSRMNNSIANIIDYETITDDILKQDNILQGFTMSNTLETINNDPQRILINNGWWLGPVLCEKNKNETFIMAYVFPLINGYRQYILQYFSYIFLICSSYFLVTYFNISSVDINQCANNEVPFGGTHKCPNGMRVEIFPFFNLIIMRVFVLFIVFSSCRKRFYIRCL